MSPKTPADKQGPSLRKAVAQACRILHREGHEHLVFGHVSARAVDGTIYVKGAGHGLEEVSAAAVAHVSAEGQPLGDSVPIHDEMPIHTGIYTARADVGAIVHTHASASVTLSQSLTQWPVTSQDAVPFWNRVVFFKHSDLITSPHQGRELAACLGSARAALLRAHGLVTVGADLAEATVNAVLFERAARITLSLSDTETTPAMAEADIAVLDERFERNRRQRIQTIWDYLARDETPR